MFGLNDAFDLIDKYVPQDETDDSIERKLYREIARHRAEKKVSGTLFNDSFADSIDIYETFFDFSESEVFILARGIKEEILGAPRVQKAAIRYLNKPNTKLEMRLCAKSEDHANEIVAGNLVQRLAASAGSSHRFMISFYQGDSKTWLLDIGSLTVGDKRMYRRRYKQETVDGYGTNANAEVNFNDPHSCAKFIAAVDNSLKPFVPLKSVIF
jgi:hypothetical protein